MNLTQLARNIIKVSSNKDAQGKYYKFGSKSFIDALQANKIQLTPFQKEHYFYDRISNKIYTRTAKNLEAYTSKVQAAQRERMAPVMAAIVRPVVITSREIGKTGNVVMHLNFSVDGNPLQVARAAVAYVRRNVPRGVGTRTPNMFQGAFKMPNGNIISTVFRWKIDDLYAAIAELFDRIAAQGGDYYEQHDPRAADYVTISYYINADIVQAVGRGSDANGVEYGDIYKTLKIETVSRCGFAAVLLSLFNQLNKTQLKAKNQALTRKYEKRNPGYYTAKGLTFEQLSEVASLCGANLTIFDNNYDIIAEYLNDHDKTAFVMYVDQHYNPVVSKDVQFIDGSIGKISEEHTDDYEIITMANNARHFNPNFLVYDIETFMMHENGQSYHRPYAIAIAWHNHDVYNSAVAELTNAEKYNKTVNDLYKQNIDLYNAGKIAERPEYPEYKAFNMTRLELTKEDLYNMPIEHVQYYGLDCIDKFLSYIYDHAELFNGKYLYAHNGSKFDINIVLQSALIKDDRFTIVKACDLNNAFISLTLKFRGDNVITFLDSCRQFPGSLASFCKEMGTPIRKLVGDVDHAAINIDNFEEHKQNVGRYLWHDVASLLQSIDAYALTVWNSYRINLVNCLTSASLSKRIFFQRFNKPETMPIYYMPMDVDRYIRSGYYGGRVECFKHGDFTGQFYYYDFTSLYPAAATGLLPYGKPEFIQCDNNFNIHDFYGFIRCRVSSAAGGFTPLHGIKVNGTLTFPYLQTATELVLFSEEIKKSLAMGLPYRYEFIDGYRFQAGNVLADFMRTAFNAKNTAKREGNAALSQASKIVANSGYGFFGLRVEDRDAVKIVHNDDRRAFAEIAEAGSYRDHVQAGNYTIMKVRQTMDTKSYNVAIAAAITSLARCMLYEAIYDIKQNGGDVYYCDTDSIITNFHLEASPLKAKYMEHDGDALGELKNEYTEKYAKYLKSVGADISNIPHHFTELIIAGCKFYACRGSINGVNIDIVKCKGLKESDNVFSVDEAGEGMPFDFNTFRRLNGSVFYQHQTQGFNCSATAKLHNYYITARRVKKQFAKVYNKGTMIDNGDVISLTL